MSKITVFEQEKFDGLEEAVQSNASIAYVSQLRTMDPSDGQRQEIIAKLKSVAKNKTQQDLYYMDSVLVTSCWNKNDDVFDKEEIWKAKETPEDKPFNIEHDEHHIIGHITGNWPVDSHGQFISRDTSILNLPDIFHIVTSSVIYKHWTDPELIARTQELIEQIEAGNKFVSMECLFTSFDYAIKSDTGETKVVARNDESAFLTKHLRAYGGGGVYEGYQVGRLLRNISFCGHGLVEKPANPSSIIFDKYNPFTAPAEGHLTFSMPTMAAQNSSEREIKMSEFNVDFYKNQISELKAEITSLSEAKTELEAKLTEAGTKEYEAKVAEQDAALTAYSEAVDASTAEIAELKEQLTEATSKLEEATSQLEQEQSEKADLKGQLDTIEAEKIRATRLARLVEAGLEPTDAEAAIEKFAELSDEQFEAIALMVSPVEKSQSDEEVEASDNSDEDDITEDEAEAAADEVNLDEVEASEEIALSASSENEDETEGTRAALSELISKKYLNV